MLVETLQELSVVVSTSSLVLDRRLVALLSFSRHKQWVQGSLGWCEYRPARRCQRALERLLCPQEGRLVVEGEQ